MANLIYQDSGLVLLLLRMADPSTRWHLFGNNFTPNRATILADLTELAGVTPANFLLVPADFPITGTALNIGSIIAAPIVFVNTSGGPLDAYGYYVTDSADANLIAALRFDSAPVTRADGLSWTVTPRLGDFSRFSS